MIRASYRRTVGTSATPDKDVIQCSRGSQIHGVFTTCMAMCGSGAKTYGTMTTTTHLMMVRRGSWERRPNESCGEEATSTRRGSVDLPSAGGTILTTGAAMLAFGPR